MKPDFKTPIQSRCAFCGGDLVEVTDAGTQAGTVAMRCLPCGVTMTFDADAPRVAGRDRGREVGYTARDRETLRMLLRIMRAHVSGPMRMSKREEDLADLERAVLDFAPAPREAEDRGRERRANFEHTPECPVTTDACGNAECTCGAWERENQTRKREDEFGGVRAAIQPLEVPITMMHGVPIHEAYPDARFGWEASDWLGDLEPKLQGDPQAVIDALGRGLRQCRTDLYTPAETAIRAAVVEVEQVGAHPMLTDAVILLGEAQRVMGRYVNDRLRERLLIEQPSEPHARNVLISEQALQELGVANDMTLGRLSDRLKEHQVLLERCERLTQAVRWALGETGDWTDPPPLRSGQPVRRFYWREELRRRAFPDANAVPIPVLVELQELRDANAKQREMIEAQLKVGPVAEAAVAFWNEATHEALNRNFGHEGSEFLEAAVALRIALTGAGVPIERLTSPGYFARNMPPLDPTRFAEGTEP